MATITYGNAGSGINMLATTVAGLFDYDDSSWSSTAIKLFDTSSNYTSFGGSGLQVSSTSGQITDIKGGTVTSIKVVIDGTASVSVTGLKTSAVKLGDAIFANNDAAFLSLILSGDDTVNGTKYDDGLVGEIGNDTLNGNAGDDDFLGGAGADKLFGGAGYDVAFYMFATKGIAASLAKASLNTNEAKGDVYSSIEGLVGSSHADMLYGDGGANYLKGGTGSDLISGAGGADDLYGGAGADDLTGGAGDDWFVFEALSESTVTSAGRDTIFDFSSADGDRVKLEAIDASTKTAGDQAFAFIGTAGFHGKAGELRYEKKASDTYIYADVNGDGKADFSIHLDDAVTLSKGSFFL